MHHQILLITLVTHWYSCYSILWGNDLRGPDEVLVRRSFFHWSNLFISSDSSTTVGDFSEYSHNMAAVPVIFSTAEPWSDGGNISHWNLHLKLLSCAFCIYYEESGTKSFNRCTSFQRGCDYLHRPLCVFSHTCVTWSTLTMHNLQGADRVPHVLTASCEGKQYDLTSERWRQQNSVMSFHRLLLLCSSILTEIELYSFRRDPSIHHPQLAF